MIMSIAIMRSDKGITITIIEDGVPAPRIQHFPDWAKAKEFIETLSW